MPPWQVGTDLIPTFYFPFILDRVNPSRLLIGDRTNLRESSNNGEPGSYQLIGSAAASEGSFGNIISIGVSDRQGPWTLDPNFPLVVDRGADSYDSDTIYVLTTNGVKVNGRRVSSARLSPGDEITLGTLVFNFDIEQ